MYEEYWGLREKPFENTPDPHFTYYSQQHEEALARMMYAVRGRKGAALLTGEYGCGKTLLSRVLWNELQLEHLYQTVSILDPRLSGIELLQEIFYQLSGGSMPQTKIDLFHLLYKTLYHNHIKGKHTVVVIDEAQSIKRTEIFEELRLLLNFQLNDSFLLTIILMGSPELKVTLSSLPQFTQRMSVQYHIRELNASETGEYIKHRLQISGAARQIFSDEACKEIFLFSKGVPRRINTICDLSLLIGFGNGSSHIDREIILKVRNDMEFHCMNADDNAPIQHPGMPIHSGDITPRDQNNRIKQSV